MAAYNLDRHELSRALTAKLQACGFSQEKKPGTKEDLFSRSVDGAPGMRVLVYTSIEGGAAREVGEDALRVVAVYTNKAGQEHGIAKAEKRVYRTGEISSIVERMYLRMREVYKLAKQSEKCPHCGAPKFQSKKGNLVCAEVCWKN